MGDGIEGMNMYFDFCNAFSFFLYRAPGYREIKEDVAQAGTTCRLGSQKQ
jgi:hypothetical protein